MSDRDDWRANIKDIDNLYDLDPVEILIFMRHQYLLTAKDMMDDDWDGMGVMASEVAEYLQSTIEQQTPYDKIAQEFKLRV